MSTRRTRILVVALTLALCGCGYTVYRYPSDRSEALGVVVETLQNDSFDPGYEFMIGDAVRREFARRGALRLMEDPTRAEWVVRGRILPIITSRQSFSSVVLTLEYEVDVSLELEVLRAPEKLEGEPLGLGLDGRVLTHGDLYLASADVEATRKNRQEALRRIAMVLATRIHDVLYEMAPPVEIEPATYELGPVSEGGAPAPEDGALPSEDGALPPEGSPLPPRTVGEEPVIESPADEPLPGPETPGEELQGQEPQREERLDREPLGDGSAGPDPARDGSP